MELWFFYAILGTIAVGINGYLIKLLADKNFKGAILTCMQGLAYFIFGLGQILTGDGIFYSTDAKIPIFLSLLIAGIIFVNLRVRIRTLEYLSSSQYFISYRVISTTFLLTVGIVFFSETISQSQLFGLILGILAIAFLFEDDARSSASTDWRHAIILLIMSVGAGALIQIIGKLQGISSFPYSTMLFYQGMMMLCISFLLDRKDITLFLHQWKNYKKEIFIGFAATTLIYLAAVWNILAYRAGGSVSIVTKIFAYSLFISIILSIIFSSEEITYKKVIAFFLTMVSLYYML